VHSIALEVENEKYDEAFELAVIAISVMNEGELPKGMLDRSVECA